MDNTLNNSSQETFFEASFLIVFHGNSLTVVRSLCDGRSDCEVEFAAFINNHEKKKWCQFSCHPLFCFHLTKV